MGLKPGYKQTEVGVIPEDWEVKPLGDFVAFQRGHDLTERDRRKGEVPVMGSAGPNGFHDTARASGPGVVIGRSGASFGQAHHCVSDFWPHNTALYVKDFFGNDPLFAFYFLKRMDFSRHNTGGAQQSLNRNFIAPIPIAVPSRREQELVAQALRDADALIYSLEQLLTKKRHLKQGAMQELLTGRKRLPSFRSRASYQQTEVGMIPDDWACKRLGELVDLLTGFPFPSKSYSQSGVRLLRGSNVKRNSTDWSFDLTSYWPDVTTELRKYSLRVGDIVVAMDGSLVGRSFASLGKDDVPSLLLQRVARIRSEVVAQAYLAFWICSQWFTDHCEVVKTTTAIPHISPADIRSFKVAIPPTNREQDAIAAVLSDMDAEVATLEAKVAKTRQVKQGMMQELLTGRIRLV